MKTQSLNNVLKSAKRDKFLKVLALSLVGVGLSACGEDTAESGYLDHVSRGVSYQEQGQYKAAIIEFKNAVKNSGGSAEPLVAYADMLNEIGRHGPALMQLQQSSAEQDVAYVEELVETYIALKKFRSAREAWTKLPDPSAFKGLFEAQILAGEGKMEAAEKQFISTLNAAQSTQEVKYEALVGLGVVQAKTGDYQSAVSSLSKVPDTSDVYAEAQVIIAGIRINELNLEEAEAILSDILSRLPNTDIMQPEKAVVLERLAYVLTRVGRSNEAYIYQKLLAEAFPGANEVAEKYTSAVKAFQRNDYAEAKVQLEAILADYPLHVKAKQMLGVIAYLEGDTLGAADYLGDSVDPEVADPLTRNIYAATSLQLNDPEKVLDILGPGAASSENAGTLTLYGLAAISNGEGKKGEQALKKAAELAPEDTRVRLALASYYRGAGSRYQSEELKYLQEAAALAPTQRQVITDLSSYYLRNEGVEHTAKFIDGLLKAHPKNHDVNLVAGYFAISQRDLDAALSRFDVAVANTNDSKTKSEALYAKGRTEFSSNSFDAAKVTFESMVAQYPASEQAYEGLLAVYQQEDGASLAAQRLESIAKREKIAEPYIVLIRKAVSSGDLASAEDYMAAAKRLESGSRRLSELERSLQYSSAAVALNEGELVKARQIISSLLNEAPDNIRLLSFVVDLEIREEKYTEASKVLAQIEGLNAAHPVLPILKGDLALAQNKLDEARIQFEQAWQQQANELIAGKLFSILDALNDEAAATSLLSSWLERIPESKRALFLQAVRYQERGQRTRASELYERLLKLSPDNVAALNNLGWIYYENGEDRSIELLSRALELAPESPAVLDSLGWALYKFGNAAKGLVHLEKAVALAPDNAEIQKHYAEVKAAQ